MTISVSVLSHAFFTERGAARAFGAEPCSVSVGSQGEDADAGAMKVDSAENPDCRNEKKDCALATPRELSTQTATKAHGRKRGNRKRGARGRQNGSERENKMHIGVPEIQERTPSSLYENAAEVLVRDIREECSSALGIVKEDLELYGLCYLPRTSERARLLKDRSGVMHVGVMVRNSDLNLRTMEELVIHKDKAEEEVESCHAEIREKVEDLLNLKVKYDKLTEEVLRLRTMVNRANHLRRESEKATEILRVEFEKLVKSLFMDRADCAEENFNDESEA